VFGAAPKKTAHEENEITQRTWELDKANKKILSCSASNLLGIKLLPGLQDDERAIYAVHDPFFVMPVGW
jgi:hypothetical protein